MEQPVVQHHWPIKLAVLPRFYAADHYGRPVEDAVLVEHALPPVPTIYIGCRKPVDVDFWMLAAAAAAAAAVVVVADAIDAIAVAVAAAHCRHAKGLYFAYPSPL